MRSKEYDLRDLGAGDTSMRTELSDTETHGESDKIEELKAILALLEYASHRAGELDEGRSETAIKQAANVVTLDMEAAIKRAS